MTLLLLRIRDWLSKETTSGLLLLGAALVALVWANSPAKGSYQALSATVVGPENLHLALPLATWAADGVLAIFFFVVGLELKRELVVGSLSNPREAAVPMVSAVGGMVVPALIYAGVIWLSGDLASLEGWAIPTATDIAFAVGVLALFGKGLPRALRTFLLTLAVVDDLLAIVVIAVFYTDGLNLGFLLVSLLFVAAFGAVVRLRRVQVLLLLLIASGAWLFMHGSGVHATIAGVLMGVTVPARPIHGEDADRCEQFSTALTPLSSGIVLPVFAFFAAGVTFVGQGDSVTTHPVFFAVAVALVLGKFVGVMGTATLVTKHTPLHLPDAIGLRDLVPIGFLTGIGFTVSLLIAELSFEGSDDLGPAKLGVLAGTVLAATLGAAALRHDARRTRSTDMNRDGRPDTDVEPL